MSSKKINAILCDLGKVIIHFDFEPAFLKASRLCKKSPDEIKLFFMQSGLEVLFDGGKISSLNFYKQVQKHLELDTDYHGFKNLWNSIFTPNEDMVDLVTRLSQSYRMVLVSNTNDLHWKYLKNKYRYLDLFDEHILSFEQKIRKPDSKIYTVSAKACKAKPQEIFYIDDRKDLTDAAKSMGFNVFTYKNNTNQLTKVMNKFGIET